MHTQTERASAKCKSVRDVIRDRIVSSSSDEAFYVAEMSDIYKKHLRWLELMPRVKPFYAVKCNDLPEIVELLYKLGTNFDCASKQEIEQVLALGARPEQIVFANPCKTPSSIEYARKMGVNAMTFDNETELHKCAQLHPQAQLILRVKGDDTSAKYELNSKFGANLKDARKLLATAKALGLAVVGVSFHNGSSCGDPNAYKCSIRACRQVFEMAHEVGHPDMHIVDVGGGFPGSYGDERLFEQICDVINASIDESFPDGRFRGRRVEFIAEPGRYYVSSCMSLMTMVIAKRVDKVQVDGDEHELYMYYLSDGVYGSLVLAFYEELMLNPTIVRDGEWWAPSDLGPKHASVLWGPTCDSIDLIKRDFAFPELRVGDWLLFDNMGAYTLTLACKFNGVQLAKVVIVDDVSDKLAAPEMAFAPHSNHLGCGINKHALELAGIASSGLAAVETDDDDDNSEHQRLSNGFKLHRSRPAQLHTRC